MTYRKLSYFILLIGISTTMLSFTTWGQSGSITLETTTDAPANKTIYGNSTPLAYGSIFITPTTALLNTGYGVEAVTRVDSGVCRIDLLNDFFGDAVVNITMRHDGTFRNYFYSYESCDSAMTVTCYFYNAIGTFDQSFSFVIYGSPLNAESSCLEVMSGTGFAQAPNDNLHFNFADSADCMDAIPFAILDPTPNIQVVVGNFVSPPATDPVEVTINHDFGGGGSQSINLTAAGATINLGTYISSLNLVPYDVNLVLTYDGTQFVTAQVVATPI